MSIQSIIRAAIADSPLAAPEDQWHTTWSAVANFCGNQMASKRGVTIPGFIIFAFTPGPKHIGAQPLKPVLWFHQQWSNLHHLRPGPSAEPRPRGPITAPVINWVAISQSTGISKHILTSIFKEISIAIGNAAQHQDVTIDFGFCRCRLGSGRYSYMFADQLLALEVPDARPTVMRSMSPQGAVRSMVAPPSLARSHPGPLRVEPSASIRSTGSAGGVAVERAGSGSSLPPITSPNGRYPVTMEGPARTPTVGSAADAGDDGADGDSEEVGGRRKASRDAAASGGVAADAWRGARAGPSSPAGSPGRTENPAVERQKRKRVLKKLHRMSRAQEYYDSWGSQVASKEENRTVEQQEARRDLEVMRVWAQEDDERSKERQYLRKQQAAHVQSMNAQLAVERATRAKPRGEPMGDVFADREEPQREQPDFEFLKRQIDEKKKREKEFDKLNEVDIQPYDFAAEKQRQLEARLASAEDLRKSYAAQIAHKKARGPQLAQAGDEELNFFFRNQTREQMLIAEAEEKKREREKARMVAERNLRDREEQIKVQRSQAADDARRERALHDATKALDDDRMVREEVERQRQKLTMVQSWENAKDRKDAEKQRQKELFHGWTDQLPYRNDSSDSDLDISEMADRVRAAEQRRKAAEGRKKRGSAQPAV